MIVIYNFLNFPYKNNLDLSTSLINEHHLQLIPLAFIHTNILLQNDYILFVMSTSVAVFVIILNLLI